MSLQFNRYAQEANTFVKNLAKDLGHPEETGRTGIILRSVMHTLRDRITISESLNMLAQLPMFLKAVYVENWKYSERPKSYHKLDDFIAEVEKHQKQFGESDFDWKISTRDIVRIVMEDLKPYISAGEREDLKAQLPEEMEEIVA